MDNTEIYIDGQRVDTNENTDVTIEMKSNFFTDIDKIECNRSYTINLPKTVRNISILGMADKLGVVNRYPYDYHTCEIRRGGVQVVRNGRASIKECEDGIAMVVYWGVFGAVQKLQESELSLKDLESDARIKFNKKNTASLFNIFTTQGYGYATYTETQARTVQEGWEGAQAAISGRKTTSLKFVDGKKTKTGTAVGGTSATTSEDDEGWQSVVSEFKYGYTAVIDGVAGTGDYRAWAVLSEDAEVLSIANDSALTESGADLSRDAGNVLGGEAYYYTDNYEKATTVKNIKAYLLPDSGERTLAYGYIDLSEGVDVHEIGTKNIAEGWQGTYSIDVSFEKPEGCYVYIQVNTMSLGMYTVENSTSGVADAGIHTWTPTTQVMMRVRYDGGKPVAGSWTIDATVDSAYLVVNHYKEAGDKPTAAIVAMDENEENDPTAAYKAIQPSVTLEWINGLIKNKTGLKISLPEDEEEQMKRLAIPIISQETDEDTVQNTKLELEVKNRTDYGIIEFTAEKLPDGLIVSSWNDTEGNTQSQLQATKAMKIRMDVRADLSYNTETLTFYDAGGGRKQTYTYAEYVRMSVGDNNYYIGGDGYETAAKLRRQVWEDDAVAKRYAMRLYGQGTIDVAIGDKIRFFFERADMFSADKKRVSLKLDNIKVTGEVRQEEGMPYGGWFPIAKNLPDIKIVDYIRFLAIITGTFVGQSDNDSTISLIHYDSVTKGNAQDWSDRLIAETRRNAPRNIEFGIDGWARNNRYRWKEDDTVLEDHDGNIEIEDSTLDYERDVCELPFAASDGDRVPIRTPMTVRMSGSEGYLKKEISGYEFEECEPRVMNVVEKVEMVGEEQIIRAALDFRIDLNDIFAKKYKLYTRCVKNAKVIKERFNLSMVEVSTFDETRPVYLRQYGQYFIVTELRVGSDGVTEATMVQINS